jgi:hypothetical protein
VTPTSKYANIENLKKQLFIETPSLAALAGWRNAGG